MDFFSLDYLIIAAIGFVIGCCASLWAERLRLAKNRSFGWPVFVFWCPPLLLILLVISALPHPRGLTAIEARVAGRFRPAADGARAAANAAS